MVELPAKENARQDGYETHQDWQLQVWDTRIRKLKWSVVCPDILSFDFSPDGTRVAFLETKDNWKHEGQVLRVYEAQSGRLVRSIPASDESWSSGISDKVQFAPDNRTLFMSADSRKKWQYTTAKEKVINSTLPDGLRGVWFDTLTGERLRTTRIPRFFKDDTAPPFLEVENVSQTSLFSEDILLSPDNKVLLVSLQTPEKSAPVYKEGDPRSSGTGPRAAHIHHLWLCNLDGTFERQLTSTTHLTQGFSPDGALFMCSDERHRVQIYDVRKGQLLHTLGGPKNYSLDFGDSFSVFQFTSGLFSRDGKRAFVTMMNDGHPGEDDAFSRVGEWDLKSGRFLRIFGKWETGYASSTIALSADDTILAHPISPTHHRYEDCIQLWKIR